MNNLEPYVDYELELRRHANNVTYDRYYKFKDRLIEEDYRFYVGINDTIVVTLTYPKHCGHLMKILELIYEDIYIENFFKLADFIEEYIHTHRSDPHNYVYNKQQEELAVYREYLRLVKGVYITPRYEK